MPAAISKPTLSRFAVASLAAVGLLLPACDAAPTADSPDTAITETTPLQERPDRLVVTLPNRMIVVAQNVPTAPVVSTQIWVKTGSVYEQEHVGAGLSHFLEHLLSGGSTSTQTEAESNALLGKMGAQVNAATGLDNVHYYINTTSSHTPEAVALLSDWIKNNLVTQEEYEREREVIQREFSMGQGDPGRIFWKLTQQARFAHLPNHPAKHPTIGYIDEFLTITRDELYDFYRRMYVPNNMVFVVVGDIDPQAVVNQITEIWGDVPAGELPELKLPVEDETNGVGPGNSTVSGMADVQRPRLRLAWPGTQLAAADDYELDLLSTILGQGESSRLSRDVRDHQRLVTSIDAYNVSFNWGRGFFGIDCELAVPEEEKAKVMDAVLAQIARLRTEPVTEAELNRAKRKTKASILKSSQTAQGIASRLARDIIGQGDPDYLIKYADKIQSITAAELRDTAARLLTPERLITVELLPQPKDTPSRPLERPEAAVDATFAGQPLDLDNARVIATLKARLAESGNDVQAIEVDAPVTYTLGNGLTLIVQRSTVAPAVSMQMYWIGGLLGDEAGKEGVANAVASMMRRGTSQHTAQELAEAVEDLGASLGVAAGNNTTYVQASSLSEDWRETLGLFAEVLTQPTFPAEEWDKLKPRLLAGIDRQKDSWWGETRMAFREEYYGEHPWSQAPLGRREVVEALTVDDLKAAYDKMTTGMHAVMAVVGDVDPEAVRDAVAELLNGLEGVNALGYSLQQPVPPTAKVVQAETGKPITAVQIGFGPGITRDDPDYATLQVLGRMMSDFPAGWLEQELRGKGPGLVYAVSAGSSVGLVPGYFTIVFNTSGEQAPEAIRRSMSVVERAKAGAITEADLTRAKAKVLSDESFSQQSNSSRAASAALDQLYGVEDPGNRKYLAEVAAMTPDKLQAAANRYLVNPVVVVLTSESLDQAELEEAAAGETVAQP